MVQAAIVALFGVFRDFLILPIDLGIILLHPGKPQDYRMIGVDHDQERDGLNMEYTDLK